MSDDLPVTVVIINYRTPDLLEKAVASLRRYYPDIHALLIDNGSHDGKSVAVMNEWKSRHPASTEFLLNPTNLHHGPAIDQAMRHAVSPLLLFLDSDCEIIKGGFIEMMIEAVLASPLHYAIGKRIWMDRRGFDLPEGTPGAIPYVRPICMLLRREIYLELPGAERHGTPCLSNFREALRQGYHLLHFPIENFVYHKGRGTAERFGYGLGWRGWLNYALHKLKI